MKKVIQFEKIQKAAEEIWYDNGMVNRHEPLEDKLTKLSAWLLKQDQTMLKNMEAQLNQLSQEELEIVCCGDEADQEQLASPELNAFLNQIFDEEYEV